MGIPWDGTGINCCGMGQRNMSHGQTWKFKAPHMNESQSWSLPSLNFLSADSTWLDMHIWLSLLNPCLHSGETRHNINK